MEVKQSLRRHIANLHIGCSTTSEQCCVGTTTVPYKECKTFSFFNSLRIEILNCLLSLTYLFDFEQEKWKQSQFKTRRWQ